MTLSKQEILNKLKTIDKSSIVNAINEVNTLTANHASGTGDLKHIVVSDTVPEDNSNIIFKKGESANTPTPTPTESLRVKMGELEEELVKIGDMSELQTSNKDSLVEAINENFTRVVNGKKALAQAINDKGGVASENDTFDELASEITNVKSKTQEYIMDIPYTNQSGICAGEPGYVYVYAHPSLRKVNIVTKNTEWNYTFASSSSTVYSYEPRFFEKHNKLLCFGTVFDTNGNVLRTTSLESIWMDYDEDMNYISSSGNSVYRYDFDHKTNTWSYVYTASPGAGSFDLRVVGFNNQENPFYIYASDLSGTGIIYYFTYSDGAYKGNFRPSTTSNPIHLIRNGRALYANAQYGTVNAVGNETYGKLIFRGLDKKDYCITKNISSGGDTTGIYRAGGTLLYHPTPPIKSAGVAKDGTIYVLCYTGADFGFNGIAKNKLILYKLNVKNNADFL